MKVRACGWWVKERLSAEHKLCLPVDAEETGNKLFIVNEESQVRSWWSFWMWWRAAALRKMTQNESMICWWLKMTGSSSSPHISHRESLSIKLQSWGSPGEGFQGCEESAPELSWRQEVCWKLHGIALWAPKWRLVRSELERHSVELTNTPDQLSGIFSPTEHIFLTLHNREN